MTQECHAIGTNDGQAMFAAREAAWHGLGTVVGSAMTTTEALKEAHLDWTVWVEDTPMHMVTRPDGTDAMVAADAQTRLVYREDGDAGAVLLGAVGSQFEPIQNAEAFGFLDALTEMQGEAHVETVGALHNGREVFLSVAWPSHLSLVSKDGREDKVEQYLLVHNGHAGNASLTVRATNVRVVCRNTLSMALRGQAERVVRIAHRGNTTAGRIAEARETLGFAVASFTAFDAAAAALYDTVVTDRMVEQAIAGFLGERPEKPGAALTRYDTRLEQVWGLYRSEPNSNVHGTAWGAWNALTEWSDWLRPVRPGGRSETQARGEAILGSAGQWNRDRALTSVLTAAQVDARALVG